MLTTQKKSKRFHLYCGDCDKTRCLHSQKDQLIVWSSHWQCKEKYMDLSPRKCDDDCKIGVDE